MGSLNSRVFGGLVRFMVVNVNTRCVAFCCGLLRNRHPVTSRLATFSGDRLVHSSEQVAGKCVCEGGNSYMCSLWYESSLYVGGRVLILKM